MRNTVDLPQNRCKETVHMCTHKNRNNGILNTLFTVVLILMAAASQAFSSIIEVGGSGDSMSLYPFCPG